MIYSKTTRMEYCVAVLLQQCDIVVDATVNKINVWLDIYMKLADNITVHVVLSKHSLNNAEMFPRYSY